MKKLLLTSSGFDNPNIWNKFLELVSKPANEIKIAFVPTAARSEWSLPFLYKARDELFSIGILPENITYFDLKDDEQIDYSQIKKYDTLYMWPWHSCYLLDRVRKTGFDKIIKQFIDAGKLYVWYSSGSILLWIDLKTTRIREDNNWMDDTALNIVNHRILPHYEEGNGYKEEKKKQEKSFVLKDGQALLVLWEEESIIE